MSNENLLRKIRALLAQAESPAATPQEAETFSAKAQEMMVRYSIDQALVDAEKPGTRETPVLRSFNMEEGYAKPKMFLLSGIASAFPTHVVQHRSRATGITTIQIVGFPSDLNLIDTLYTSLLLQGLSAVNRQARGDRSFRTSFWYGFAQRVAQRAADTYKRVTEEVVNETAGTSLVLVERKGEVHSFVQQQYASSRMGKVARPNVRSGEGFTSGTEAADRANMGGTSVTGRRRALAH